MNIKKIGKYSLIPIALVAGLATYIIRPIPAPVLLGLFIISLIVLLAIWKKEVKEDGT